MIYNSNFYRCVQCGLDYHLYSVLDDCTCEVCQLALVPISDEQAATNIYADYRAIDDTL